MTNSTEAQPFYRRLWFVMLASGLLGGFATTAPSAAQTQNIDENCRAAVEHMQRITHMFIPIGSV
ncbi:hypothetical protein SAMN02910353_01607 [Ruminococcus sp. YRD2003]|uniref:hypothetical protein n=1 Tax=Ruminococcus sp. YRD2003 TaxID=1452313 RepID=UPI0008B543B6|nr:hypothetical protein SAMN02910353_01607 [Ruminococcus flavefaciens]